MIDKSIEKILKLSNKIGDDQMDEFLTIYDDVNEKLKNYASKMVKIQEYTKLDHDKFVEININKIRKILKKEWLPELKEN